MKMGKDIPGRGNGECRGSEVGIALWAQGTERRPVWLEHCEQGDRHCEKRSERLQGPALIAPGKPQ